MPDIVGESAARDAIVRDLLSTKGLTAGFELIVEVGGAMFSLIESIVDVGAEGDFW